MNNKNKYLAAATLGGGLIGLCFFLYGQDKKIKQKDFLIQRDIKTLKWYNSLDKASLANLDYLTTEQTQLNIEINLSQKYIKGQVCFIMKVLKTCQIIQLDCKFLKIKKVIVNDKQQNFQIQSYAQHGEKLGDQLNIFLDNEVQQENHIKVEIKFQTISSEHQNGATALSWLNPNQTFGQKHPFLFTQCEPIYCRTLFPCQDSPSVKSIYHIYATIEKPYSVYFSGILNLKQDSYDGKYNFFEFKQDIPIPSYLFSIVAGNLEMREVSKRNIVISEPEIIDKCAQEFSLMDSYLEEIEKIIFEYKWKTYTVVVLPKSFPFGGMENPNLTFVSPSIVVGDKSATDVVIHEMVHSWSGNLMSCANWESFWLNEGFTVFFERETVRNIYGEEIYQIECVNGDRQLKKTIASFPLNHSFTSLKPNLEHENPDDAFSSIPYEKGFQYLRFLQEKFGREQFQLFMRLTISKFQLQSVSANQFKEFLLNYMQEQNLAFDIQWEVWVETPGLPPMNLPFETQVVERYQKYIDLLFNDNQKFFDDSIQNQIKGFSAKEKIFFLDQLLLVKEKLTIQILTHLDQSLQILSSWKNSELTMRFLSLAIFLNYDTGNCLLEFLQSTGRMKFIRPLYSQLAITKYHQAKDYYNICKSSYHSIANEQIHKLFIENANQQIH